MISTSEFAFLYTENGVLENSKLLPDVLSIRSVDGDDGGDIFNGRMPLIFSRSIIFLIS